MMRYLIYLNAQQLQIGLWQQHRLQQQTTLSYDQLPRLTTLLKADIPCYLLVDCAEEDFQRLAMPPLAAGERKLWLQHQLQQHYPDTPYHLLQHGAATTDQALLSALTQPQRLTPLLSQLHARHQPLAAIYSLAQLGAVLVNPHGDSLLISWQAGAGIRQSLYQDGQLRLTRLSPCSSEQQLVQQFMPQLQQTLQFIQQQQMLNGHALQLKLLLSKALQQQLQPAFNHSGLSIEIMPLAQADASGLYLQQLACQRPKSHYSTSQQRRDYRLWQLGRAIRRSGWLGLATSLSAACWAGWQYQPLHAQQQRVQQQISHLQQLQQAHPSPITAAQLSQLQHTLQAASQLQRPTPQLLSTLQPLSQVMNDFPQVKLQQLRWQYHPMHENTVTTVQLQAELNAFKHHYRQAEQYFQRFQQRLSRHYRLTLLQPPLQPGKPPSQIGMNFDLQLEVQP